MWELLAGGRSDILSRQLTIWLEGITRPPRNPLSNVNSIKEYLFVFLRVWIRIWGFRVWNQDLEINGLELGTLLNHQDPIIKLQETINLSTDLQTPTSSIPWRIQRLKKQVNLCKCIIDRYKLMQDLFLFQKCKTFGEKKFVEERREGKRIKLVEEKREGRRRKLKKNSLSVFTYLPDLISTCVTWTRLTQIDELSSRVRPAVS